MSSSGWVTTPSWLFESLTVFRKVLLYILVTSSSSLLLSLGPCCFFYCAHLCKKCSLGILIFLRFLVFLILLFPYISLYFSLLKAFLSLLPILWNSAFNRYIFSFILCLLLLFFSQLFVRPPQTTTLSSCICFSRDGFGHYLLYNVMNLCP